MGKCSKAARMKKKIQKKNFKIHIKIYWIFLLCIKLNKNNNISFENRKKYY